MSLKRFFLLITLSICFQINAQNDSGVSAPFINKSFDAFKPGESLKFRIHYGFFNASYATLDLNEEIFNNQKIFKATAIGRTSGIARFFFKVEDVYETFFDQFLVKPLKSTRNIYEGGYTKNTEILYDYNNNLAKVNDIKNSKISSVNIEKNVQDLISTFYFLRNHFDVNSLKINDFIRITIFFDAENYPFRMKFLGYENIKTKFGVINCLKFRPYIESGRVFSDSESLTLWVSNDKNKIPIKIEAGLRIGSIEADLEEFRGLKHPFKVNVNE